MSQSINRSLSARHEELEAAHLRGLVAGRKVQPRLDDTSPVVRECSKPGIALIGRACVLIWPATSPLARAAARDFAATSIAVLGGLLIFMSPFGDCYERNLAYATEFMSALAECGHQDLAVSPVLA